MSPRVVLFLKDDALRAWLARIWRTKDVLSVHTTSVNVAKWVQGARGPWPVRIWDMEAVWQFNSDPYKRVLIYFVGTNLTHTLQDHADWVTILMFNKDFSFEQTHRSYAEEVCFR